MTNPDQFRTCQETATTNRKAPTLIEKRGFLRGGLGPRLWRDRLHSFRFARRSPLSRYFGPRLLNPVGFTEHKVDQAWIINRGKGIEEKRIDDALAFVKGKIVTFHYGEEDAEDFDENATREQLRDYLAVLDMVTEFKADCLGWQYQLGLVPLRPPSDFAEGLFRPLP